MINWITNWAEAIIIAVVIATIIEMILPEGNCKKYIKVVIGVYILFTIISPVITKFTGKTVSVSDLIDLSKYVDEVKEKEKSQNLLAQNNETKGATFFFTLPYRQEAADIQSTPQTYLNDALHLSADIDRKQPQQDSIEKFHSILIVEDDRDLCNYLICNLQVLFEEVYEAHDGMEALPILTSRRPQIVLSDIKMPRMNGFELCRYIKQKPDLNYMPVILLTSCVDDTSMEEGYKMGAEAYITKPFDMDLLFIQIQNIMHNHNFMKNHYATIDIPIQKQENLNYINEQLMIQFNRIINENISNVNMDVNFIAQQMGMSRASLYNKTKGMMDMGISEYIIKCRLEYARKLLDTTTLSIGEVAEQTGFKHSRNFSTVFKNIEGMSPSDYRKKDSRPSCK